MNSNGTFSYTSSNYIGTDTFTYKVNNGAVDSNTSTVTLTISNTTPTTTTATFSDVQKNIAEQKVARNTILKWKKFVASKKN